VAKEAMRLAAAKLPLHTRFVTSEEAPMPVAVGGSE